MISPELTALCSYRESPHGPWFRGGGRMAIRRLGSVVIPGWRVDAYGTEYVATLCGPGGPTVLVLGPRSNCCMKILKYFTRFT